MNSPTHSFSTPYGIVTLYKNEVYIGRAFEKGSYWDIDTLLKLKYFIPPNRNILEIGGHCGTSSLVYASFLTTEGVGAKALNATHRSEALNASASGNKSLNATHRSEVLSFAGDKSLKLYVFEPQLNMYNLLCKNITQNSLEDKIIPFNLGMFCYEGIGSMNDIDLDGGGGVVEKRYTEETDLPCNFGGIGLGSKGESIKLTTIDSICARENIQDIGFIHCDAQGAENFIFSKGIETITRDRPFILYENNEKFDRYLYENVCKAYPQYENESKFDIKKYCLEQLNYSGFIQNFNGSIDTLLIP